MLYFPKQRFNRVYRKSLILYLLKAHSLVFCVIVTDYEDYEEQPALDYLSSGICPEFLDSSARAGLIESRLTLTRN